MSQKDCSKKFLLLFNNIHVNQFIKITIILLDFRREIILIDKTEFIDVVFLYRLIKIFHIIQMYIVAINGISSNKTYYKRFNYRIYIIYIHWGNNRVIHHYVPQLIPDYFPSVYRLYKFDY
jgi:hypothetical protein